MSDSLEEICECGHPLKCHAPMSYCYAHTWPELKGTLTAAICPCERFSPADPLEQLRTGLRSLLAETDRLRGVADENGWNATRIALSIAETELREARKQASLVALRQSIADTHEGRVYPWPGGTPGTDTSAEALNASEQAHSPISGDCSGEGAQ